jgi:serine/threonine protein kinase
MSDKSWVHAMKYCPICDKGFGDEVTICDVDGSVLRDRAPRPDTLVGRTIRGRYRVLERLGEGGMAIVYLAEQINVERKVALKVLHGRYSEDEEFVKRFRQEARLAASLNHSSVIRIYDFDQAADGMLFIAMEYLKGRNLKEFIQARVVDVEKAVGFGIQIAEGLATAHRAGVIHRDVKPENIMVLSGDQDIKLMDFGIARLRESDAATRLTRAGMIMGTPLYMAPEQIEGGDVTERTDIYAFGIVLYEMLSGIVPFRAPTPSAVLMKHLKEVPMPLRKLRGEIPASIERIVIQTLEKKPDRRPKTMDQVVSALRDAERTFLQQTLPKTMVMTGPLEDLNEEAADAISHGRLGRLRAWFEHTLQREEIPEREHESDKTGAKIDGTMILSDQGAAKTIAATVAVSSLGGLHPRKGFGWRWAGIAVGVATLVAIAGVSTYWVTRPSRVKSVAAVETKNNASQTLPAPRRVVSLVIRPEKNEFSVNEKVKVRFSVEYDDGYQQDLSDGVTWRSSNPSVVQIDPSGKVEGKSSGSADLIAWYGNVEARPIKLTVKEVSPAKSIPENKIISVAVRTGRTEINVNERLALLVRGKYSNGRENELAGVRWESSNPGIASIDSRGVLVGLKEGRTMITARYQGFASKPVSFLVRAPLAVKLPARSEVKNVPVQGSEKAAATQERPSKEKQIDAALKNAGAHLDRGEYSDAFDVLEKIQKVDPSNRKISAAIDRTKKACNAEKTLGRADLKC